MHDAVYQFQIYHGNIYWLCLDNRKQCTRPVMHGPDEWFTGKPEEYEYICRVKWLGDHSWIEVDSNGSPIS